MLYLYSIPAPLILHAYYFNNGIILLYFLICRIKTIISLVN